MLISAPFGSSGFFADFGAAKKKAAKRPKVAKKAVKPTGPSTAATKAALKTAAKRLQTALVLLGRTAGDTTLASIKIDGAAGQKTADAVNRVFTKHIGAGQAAAQYRTGKLPLTYVQSDANTIAAIIEKEIVRRGGAVVSPAVAVAGTAKYKASLKKAAALAKQAAKAKTAAVKTSAKRAAALKAAKVKSDAAVKSRMRAITAGNKAKQARALAGRTKDPAAKARLAAQAAALENEAQKETGTAVALETEVRQDVQTSSDAAPQQVAQEAAAEAASVEAQRQAAASSPATSSVARMQFTPEETSPGSDAASLLPTAAAAAITAMTPPEDISPSASSESPLARYKIPLIIGGLGLAGVVAFLMLKKPTTHKPAHARAR